MVLWHWASLIAKLVKNPPAKQETPVHISGLGRSTGDGIGYPLQYSGPEKSMDCIVHGVAKNWTRLSDFHFSLLHLWYFDIFPQTWVIPHGLWLDCYPTKSLLEMDQGFNKIELQVCKYLYVNPILPTLSISQYQTIM